MSQPTEEEKREMFRDALGRISAIEFPKQGDHPQKIYLLFHDEYFVKVAVFFLQDYQGSGFSLIIEKTNDDIVTLKIYEPDTDEFHECKNVPVRTRSFEIFKHSHQGETFLSVGLLELIDSKPKIHPVTFLEIPIKSISFKESDD